MAVQGFLASGPTARSRAELHMRRPKNPGTHGIRARSLRLRANAVNLPPVIVMCDDPMFGDMA